MFVDRCLLTRSTKSTTNPPPPRQVALKGGLMGMGKPGARVIFRCQFLSAFEIKTFDKG